MEQTVRDPPMATAGRGQKTTFLRDLFGSDPNVKYQSANQAWKAANNGEDLSINTFYNAKTKFKKESESAATTSAKVAPKPKAKPAPPKVTLARKATKPSSAPANGKAVASQPQVSPEVALKIDRHQVFDELEAGIDDLIFRLKTIGGAAEIEAKLREVRRLLHPSMR
jgi:hypothetical protein